MTIAMQGFFLLFLKKFVKFFKLGCFAVIKGLFRPKKVPTWMHISGNMLFLYIFSNNVNDKLGNLVYLGN